MVGDVLATYTDEWVIVRQYCRGDFLGWQCRGVEWQVWAGGVKEVRDTRVLASYVLRWGGWVAPFAQGTATHRFLWGLSTHLNLGGGGPQVTQRLAGLSSSGIHAEQKRWVHSEVALKAHNVS